MKIVMLGPFGLHPKATMLARALPAARALAAHGHEVVLVMPPWHTPEEAGKGWDDAVPGVRLEYVGLEGLAVPGLGHLRVAARMARRVRALEADVVHVFKPKAYGGLAGGILHWLRRFHVEGERRPALVVDTDDWEGPGGWNALEPYSATERMVFTWQERAGLSRHADVVTVASRALETLVWAFGLPPERVHYLPNALDDSPAGPDSMVLDAVSEPDGGGTPATGAPPTRPFTLLLYTRFFEFELERPLLVLAKLRETHPDARLLVVGKGLFGEEQRFRDLADQMGLGDALEDRGWVDEAALVKAIRDSDVGIYPFDDTLINRSKSSAKLLRLLSAGLPMVAEAVGQNAELIESGKSGLLVPADEPDAFAEALRSLADDPGLGIRLGEGARQRVRDRFRWSRRVSELEAAYRQAIDLRKSGNKGSEVDLGRDGDRRDPESESRS